MAERHAASPAPRTSRPSKTGVSPILVIILLVLALLAGTVFGCLVLGGTPAVPSILSASSISSLSEGQLDDVVATYQVDGKRNDITYRDAILESGSLSAMKKSDGSYRVPSADSVLAVARSRVISAEAERLGITVGDAEVNAYAMATFGTTDMGTISTAYGMEADAAAVLLREAALMSQVRDQALLDEVGEAPVAPPVPQPGEEVAETPEYASYIITLADKEWDAAADTWASTDGPYASALTDYRISSAGASYEAACQAYYVAYQRHVVALSDYSAQWTDYVNGLLGDASISISTLGI